MKKSILEVFGEKSKDGDNLKPLIDLMDKFVKSKQSSSEMPILEDSYQQYLPSDYEDKPVYPWLFEHMLESSREPSLTGKIYDLKGRLGQANLPKNYSFKEMKYPLGSMGAADYDINIMDILDQRNLLKFLTDKTQQSSNIFQKSEYGIKKKDIDKLLGSLDKLSYMIDYSLKD